MDMPVEKKIVFELNGRSVEAIEGETILEAADRIGIEIPVSVTRKAFGPMGTAEPV